MVERINRFMIPSIVSTVLFYVGGQLNAVQEGGSFLWLIGTVICLAGLVFNIGICFYTHAAGIVFKRLVMWPWRKFWIIGIIPLLFFFQMEIVFLVFLPTVLLVIAKIFAVR